MQEEQVEGWRSQLWSLGEDGRARRVTEEASGRVARRGRSDCISHRCQRQRSGISPSRPQSASITP